MTREYRDVPDRPNPYTLYPWLHGGRHAGRETASRRRLPADPNPLTDRERDVLAAADGGATVADIAGLLFLSESTVRNYLSSAIGKTGTRNRIEAVQAARHNGWL